MDITLEMVDQVRERTGVTYEEAREALRNANGDVVDAIIAIEKDCTRSIDVNEKIDGLVEKIKAAVQKGNVNRIRVMRGGEELVNIPVNAGIAGGVLGVLAGPAVLLSAAVAGAVAKFGFDCSFELVKEDGSVEEICGVGTKEESKAECKTETKEESKDENKSE